MDWWEVSISLKAPEICAGCEARGVCCHPDRVPHSVVHIEREEDWPGGLCQQIGGLVNCGLFRELDSACSSNLGITFRRSVFNCITGVSFQLKAS